MIISDDQLSWKAGVKVYALWIVCARFSGIEIGEEGRDSN
jgi:hypothetical protein